MKILAAFLIAISISGLVSGVVEPAYRSDVRGDRDRDGVPNRVDRDRDGDGVRNSQDRRPNDPRRY